jgi:hypothetical protein
MPASVLIGKDGTVWTVGGSDYIGKYKSFELRLTQKIINTSGPQDDYEYNVGTRLGCRLTGSAFVPAAGSAAADLIIAGAEVTVTGNILDGRTFTGTFVVPEVGLSTGDDANEESITLESTGSFTLA